MGDTLSVEYFPHHKQKDFHSSKAKFRLICTGVGFGKSAAGVNELIIQAMSAKAGCQFVMIAPTFRMLKNATLREFFKFCPHELVKKYNRSDNTIQLINDTEIICLSGDNERDLDRIRGLNIGGAYGDEVALCPEYLHDILVARLRDARGSLKLWYTTTPKGFNWLYRLFFEKKRKDNTYLDDPHDYEIFGGKTRDNPYTPKEYKKAMESLYVGAFAKQELEGSFIGFEGLVYKNFSADVHIIDSKDFHPVRLVAGIDWGFTNPQVYLLCGVDSDDRVCVLKEFYESQIQMTQFIDVVKSINASFTKKYHDNGVTGVDCCYADPSEPRYIAKLNSEGIRTQAANNDIMPGINQIFSRLET
ncbi:MAG: phage terminase large subunit, partial [Halanaerobiales bacterium]|nr:phage terminase large subunit [Halanaerobiales bacterium]